jgi:hypothetical protein
VYSYNILDDSELVDSFLTLGGGGGLEYVILCLHNMSRCETMTNQIIC